MKIKKLMNREVVSIPVEAKINEAAAKMKEYNVGAVLVLSEDEKLEGILTDRDIVISVAAEDKNPNTTCAYDIMVTDPVVIHADADVDAALRIMNTSNVRRLPVCDNGNVIGMLSSADIASVLKEGIDQFMGMEEAFAKHA